MMEKIHTLKLYIETDDYKDLENIIEDVRTTLKEGWEERRGNYYGNMKGCWKLTAKMRCERCYGTGEVATDESDGEGHIMRGVNLEKCLCQK